MENHDYEESYYEIKEVQCRYCGTYFELSTENPELLDIFGECPVCGAQEDHIIVGGLNGLE